MKNKKHIVLYLVSFFIVSMGGAFLFASPNVIYLSIINTNDYLFLSWTIIIIATIIIFFLKQLSIVRRALISLCISICVLISIGSYFYLKLPQYRYEDAVKIIEEDVTKKNSTMQIYIPKERVLKIGKQKHEFLKITNYVYYIHVNYKDEKIIYRFYPISGLYKKTDFDLKD